MSAREKSPAIIVLVGLMLIFPVTCFFWWWAANRQDETMDLRDGVSVLAPTPKWSDLKAYQNTMTRDGFASVLDEVYSEGPAWKTAIMINDDHAIIRTADQPFRLDFAPAPTSEAPRRYWRAAEQMPLAESDAAERPLEGVRIAIDPGHIGGDWAKMEERWYQIDGEGTEVKEGELTLRVAKLLKPQLEALGAQVTLVRESHEPVTKKRPADFLELATQELAATNQDPAGAAKRSEIMFYRWSEIRARAALINSKIKPDLTLCLHFNAEAWNNPKRPRLSQKNHLHLLINGTYSNAEFNLHDQRLDLMQRLLQRIHPEELALSTAGSRLDGGCHRAPSLPLHAPERQASQRLPVCLRAQPDGEPHLLLPDRLPGTLRDEQPGSLREDRGWRLRG